MPVSVPVSQVRQALYEAAGFSAAAGEGERSTPVLGMWFHETVRYLVGGPGAPGPLDQLDDLAVDLEGWRKSLLAAAYAGVLGPHLMRERAALHREPGQVLNLWRAIQSACEWLAELKWQRKHHGQHRPTAERLTERPIVDWLTMEAAISCELREPAWTDSVRLTGIADAIFRIEETATWCAVELKLGQTAPVADLAQACLYHLILSRTCDDGDHNENRHQAATAQEAAGTLALVSFRPERHEQLFSAAELSDARGRLIDVIGKLAGVDPQQAGTPPQPPSRPVPPVDPPPRRLPPESLEPHPDHIELGRQLAKVWRDYEVNVTLTESMIAGPTFIRFPIALGRGTTVSKVSKLAPELQVRLKLKAPPLVSVDEGQLVVDVQRPERLKVMFDDVRHDMPSFDPAQGGSHVPIGVNLSGRLVCANLATTEHAHLLVAGTTGSGKSEWLRLAIAGLLMTNTPETFRLLVIDPKRNAFHELRSSPYLWQPIVYPDEHPAAEALEQLVEEMERRYRLADGADNLLQMRARSGERLPRIVCVCDEYRDLISRDRMERKEIEAQISRLGAKARAAGIHLILATQEVSRDTIKGPLDANIPARVGLKTGKAIESRMLLGEPGAESLLNHGDLLFKDVGEPRRLQAPLLSEENRRQIFGGAAV